ncbi:MAG: transglutaminase family protein [Pseudomonadota bacterium]
MRLSVSHVSHYTYPQPVSYGLLQARLWPKDNANQTVLDWTLDVTGGSVQTEFQDQHHNHVALILQDPDVQSIRIEARGNVDTKDGAGIIGKHGGYSPLWLFLRQTDRTKPSKALRAFSRQFSKMGDDRLAMLHALSAAIAQSVTYATATTDVTTTADDAFVQGQGVCQDHAHIFLSVARMLGVPARYVSGYLMLNDTVDQDASHAWVEGYIPALGWVGFDISNRISPDERYIRVATGLDYDDATPLKGHRLGTEGDSLVVSLQVQQ